MRFFAWGLRRGALPLICFPFPPALVQGRCQQHGQRAEPGGLPHGQAAACLGRLRATRSGGAYGRPGVRVGFAFGGVQDGEGGEAVYRYRHLAVGYGYAVGIRGVLLAVGDGKGLPLVDGGDGEGNVHRPTEAVAQGHVVDCHDTALLLPPAELLTVAAFPAVVQQALGDGQAGVLVDTVAGEGDAAVCQSLLAVAGAGVIPVGAAAGGGVGIVWIVGIIRIVRVVGATAVLLFKDGNKGAVACYGEGIVCAGAYFLAAFRPLYKAVAAVCRGTDRYRRVFRVTSAAGNLAALCGGCAYGDLIAPRLVRGGSDDPG